MAISASTEEGLQTVAAGFDGFVAELRSNKIPATAEDLRLRTARNLRENDRSVERPKNGLAEPQIRRRLVPPVGSSRTTPGGFSPAHSLGLRDSQSSPQNHPESSSQRPTPNSYHDNSSANSANKFYGTNDSSTASSGKTAPARSAWALPELVQPLHRRRTRAVKPPKILPHYPAVIEFVYNHRYATGFQIQRRFTGCMANERTRQYQLAALTELRYLRQAPVRSTSPNFPAVYAATRRGIGLVSQTYADLGIAWKGVASEQLKTPGLALDSVLHEILLTEFDIGLREAVEGRGDIALLMHERRYFQSDRRLEFEFNGQRKSLMPDAGFLLRFTTAAREESDLISQRLQLNFVELDNGTMSAARLAAKYAAYQQWSISSSGQEYLRRLFKFQGRSQQQPNFRLLIVTRGKTRGRDDRRLAELFALALDLPRSMRDRLWLATVTDLQVNRDAQSPVTQTAWIRVRDARSWIRSFKKLAGNNSSMRVRNKTAFVAERLASLPRHTLLPVKPTNALVGLHKEKTFVKAQGHRTTK